MKQLSKLESVVFLLGGVLMVIGAACFAFGFSHPQLVQITSWGFLLGTILFSVMQAMQIYEGPSLVYPSPEEDAVCGRHLLRALGHLDGRYSVCFSAPLV